MSHYVHRLAGGLESRQTHFDSKIASFLYYNNTEIGLFEQSLYIKKLLPWINQYGFDKIHIVDGDKFV